MGATPNAIAQGHFDSRLSNFRSVELLICQKLFKLSGFGSTSFVRFGLIRHAGLEAVDAPVRCRIRLRLVRYRRSFWSVSLFDLGAVSSSRPADAK